MSRAVALAADCLSANIRVRSIALRDRVPESVLEILRKLAEHAEDFVAHDAEARMFIHDRSKGVGL